jgi:hypothetical protein
MKMQRLHSSYLTTKVLMVLTLMAVTLVGSAKEVQGEAKRQRDNTARVAKMNPYMQPKIRAVIADMESHGYKPLIDVGVWRSPAEQAAKVRAGYSKTQFSFHTATTPKGKPDSLAADITDTRWGWSASAPDAYWLKLASAARSHDLDTGILWGLSATRRKIINDAIGKRNWKYSGPLGWDVAHVEQTQVTVGQARKGLRPRVARRLPILVINGSPIRAGAAYLANGHWFVLQGEIAARFGRSTPAPATPIAVRQALAAYGQTIVSTSDRRAAANRFEVSTAPATAPKGD